MVPVAAFSIFLDPCTTNVHDTFTCISVAVAFTVRFSRWENCVLASRNPPVVNVQRPMATNLSCRVAIQCRFHGNPRLRRHRDSTSPPGMGVARQRHPEPTGTCYNWFTAYSEVRGCQFYSRVALGWDRETGLKDHTSTWMSWHISRSAHVVLSCFLCRPNETRQQLGTSWHTRLLARATKSWKEPFLCRGLWDCVLFPTAFYTVHSSSRSTQDLCHTCQDE